ncbi:MAG TPA: HAMP domain-containing sensor histidine kinase, partial [Nitrososphaeraceae archaeon]|nr:HAMP domain-containing sensor histidine kinase [Nitrososphaeraceae archaeon]
QGLREKQLCIYASVDAYDTSHLSKISQKINDYEENIIKRNLIILNLKPFYDSALAGDLTPFDEFYVQLQQELKLNRNNGVLIVADCADNLFRDKHFDQCNIVEKWWQDVYIKWLQQHQNHVFNVVCPHSGSLLSRHPFDQRKHQLSHNHSVIIDIGGNTINTGITYEQSEESNRQLNATVIDLRESINHLHKVNKELNTKYNNQREFVSLAAHELRSPILPILGTLELIEYEFEESGKKEIKLQREHFERIMRNTKRLERLASEILDVTKIDDQSLRLNKTYFNLKEIVLDLVQDHRRQLEKGNGNTKLLCEFKKEQEEEVPTRREDFSPDIFINADKNRINQVIDNILANAIKFTKEGIVSISIILKKGKNHTDAIIVRVRDTGTGIHPEILPRLFSKFATSSEIGTGLGLFLSKNIVEAHGGKIWGENNTDGKGATFVFSLP